MRFEEHLYCPPLVWLSGVQAHGYLLAWVKHEKTGEWRGVVTWTRVSGDRTNHQRLVITAEARGLRPMEAPAAYAGVPRLLLTTSGEIEVLSGGGV
ncbi:hypothetical protein [Actinomadura rudentiformis]|uniref:Uncharacterized protein n=1 Tax=Actinomadura rudentiformis TaxID=359158 RepID=A0A6H9Z8W9_9ACTN|nr:hypothetical protein [Actinomadura rudentiformis]KAB2350336.1 hypothetical protein F8566_11210 [Actinomadura rudentiformis]